MAGGGDHIASRCLVMGRAAGAPGTREEQAPNLRLLCSGQVPRATLGSGSGLRAKSWRLVHRPHPCIRPLSTLPNDKATREFCFRRAPGVLEGTYIHAAVGTAKEGALRAGLCCRRGGALSTLVDPQLCCSVIPPKPPSEGLKSPFWRDWVRRFCVRLS